MIDRSAAKLPGPEPTGLPLRVVYQGEPGAFSEQAALAWFGKAAVLEPTATLQDVAVAVIRDEADAGVLPVENTVAGGVALAYDVLGAVPTEVVGEVIRPIEMCLLGLPGARIEGLRRVASHPVALAQCTAFLGKRPGIEAVQAHDTAGAARQVAELADPAAAAIASRWAAERYGLEVLAKGIQDHSDNQTRFFVVQRANREPPLPGAPSPAPGTPWKMAIALETEHRPGALAAVLVRFARKGVDLTHLECRPGLDAWTYRFFLDVTSADRKALDAALAKVRKVCTTLRVLGRFPAAGA